MTKLHPGEWRHVSGVEYRCARCGHIGRSDRQPDVIAKGLGIRCGNCKSPRWWIAAGKLTRGRPPAA